MSTSHRNYTEEEKNIALSYYHQCGSVPITIKYLGFPSRTNLRRWLSEEGLSKEPRKVQDRSMGPATYAERMNAIHRCFELNEDIYFVSKDINRDVTTIRAWYQKYLRGGSAALMGKTLKRKSNSKAIETDDVEVLKSQLLDLQLENDILKETIDILKKDPGIDQSSLKNREKAVIVDALRCKYSLPTLLNKMQLSKSSYYYQESSLKKEDKYKDLRLKVVVLFINSNETYGYRRIWGELTTGENPITISEKIIRKIMREECLIAKRPKLHKYSSYQGEISPEVENIVNRKFHADNPNELWLTDITEFSIPAGKIYLSAIVDCFDGYLPSWNVGISPNAELVNTMLDDATNKLSVNDHPIIHSDRGCHYRWPGWISRVERAGLTRSMSKKGCSPDNSACEGLFGRIKIEMFYYKNWYGISIQQFIEKLNEYLKWYNEKRIKKSLNYMSPLEYRLTLGLVA